MSENLQIRHIHGESQLKAYQHYVEQAIQLYIEIFRDPPYNEHFNYEDVKIEFEDYIQNGCFLLGTIGPNVAGFMCSSIGITHIDQSIESDMIKSGIDYENDIYISELGVSKIYRGKGFSRKLIKKFMDIHPTQNMFLRTGVNNNDHVIRLYQSYGFTITNIREFVINTRANGEEEEDERLYMFRKEPVSHSESKDNDDNNDDHLSGAEYLYGTNGHYDNDDNNNSNNNENYKSGSEYLY